MRETKIILKDASIHTYESLGSYPELKIDMNIMFTNLDKQIDEIQLGKLKEMILKDVESLITLSIPNQKGD